MSIDRYLQKWHLQCLLEFSARDIIHAARYAITIRLSVCSPVRASLIPTEQSNGWSPKIEIRRRGPSYTHCGGALTFASARLSCNYTLQVRTAKYCEHHLSETLRWNMKVFKAINLCVCGPTNASYWERHPMAPHKLMAQTLLNEIYSSVKEKTNWQTKVATFLSHCAFISINNVRRRYVTRENVFSSVISTGGICRANIFKHCWLPVVRQMLYVSVCTNWWSVGPVCYLQFLYSDASFEAYHIFTCLTSGTVVEKA